MSEAKKESLIRQKGTLKNGYHILTVRFVGDEWDEVMKLQEHMRKRQNRKITYNEVIVNSVKANSVLKRIK